MRHTAHTAVVFTTLLVNVGAQVCTAHARIQYCLYVRAHQWPQLFSGVVLQSASLNLLWKACMRRWSKTRETGGCGAWACAARPPAHAASLHTQVWEPAAAARYTHVLYNMAVRMRANHTHA